MMFLALLASSGAALGACGSHDSEGAPAGAAGDSTAASAPATQSAGSALASQASADVIDVRSGSRMSLALRGGLGPIISGQSITKATVSIRDLELVDTSGASVPLATGPFTGDLIALQDQLGPIFSQQSVQAGQYTALRFRLGGAAIEAQDDQGAATVYASQGFDTSQFSDVTSVQTLQLGGLDSDGFVTCALPPGGLVVDGASSLALQFAFAQSLVVQSGGAWVLTPRCFLIDQSAFSSLDVDFQLASSVTSYSQYLTSGFLVMLLDSNLYPICEVPLVVFQSVTFRASFVYLASFEGPFVAALVPPSGFSLQSTVAFSVDVQQSAACSASVSVTSFEVVSGRSFSIGTDDQCRVVQRDRRGQVLAQTSEPIGAVEDVAPTMHHRQPVAPGEQPPAPAETPQLPGNPPPKMGHGHRMMPPTMPSATSTGHGKMPPTPTPTSTGQGMMPPAPTPTSTEHGKMPPAPSSTQATPGTPAPSTPPPATTGTSGPPTPSGTATAPPSPKGRGGPPPSPPVGNPNPQPTGAPTPPPPGPASTGSPPSPPTGGRGPRGGGPTPPSGGPMAPSSGPTPPIGGAPPTSSGNPHGGGGGGGRFGH